MLYVDTSVWVALCTHEGKTAAALQWYEACTNELISAAWCVTEFARALGLKQRTGQLNVAQAQMAWVQFERICANDLQLLPINTRTFHAAAHLTLNPATALSARNTFTAGSPAKATALKALATPVPTAVQPLPATLPEQVRAVAQVLASSPVALSLSALEAHFKGCSPWKKGLPMLLQTLEALGRAQPVTVGDAVGDAVGEAMAWRA